MRGLSVVPLTLLAGLAPSQDHVGVLHWQNGGRLEGTLNPGAEGELRWSSPLLAEELSLAPSAIEAVRFKDFEVGPPKGSFRVSTSSGDVWTADLIGSDEESFLLASERLGQVRVPRGAVRMLERIDDVSVLLDASRFIGGVEQLRGPIKDLVFWVYDDLEEVMRRTRATLDIPPDVPGPQRLLSLITDNQPDDIRLEFRGSAPAFAGKRSRGFLDLGLNPSGDFEFMAMAFEGRFEVKEPGRHGFVVRATHGARLFVDGELVVEGRTLPGPGGGPGEVRRSFRDLGRGWHDLEVVFFNYVKEEHLSVTMTGPDDVVRTLTGTNIQPSWERGPAGYARTDRMDTRLWIPVELPERFEVEVELTSSATPRFLLALSGSGEEQPILIETWEDLLVLTQGDVFEPLVGLEGARSGVDLRLLADTRLGTLTVLDASGRELGVARGIQFPSGETGLALRNRGDDLTARRLVVRRARRGTDPVVIELGRARVLLRDGRVLYGQLELGEDGAYVRGEDGVRQAFDLEDLDRALDPEVPQVKPGPATLSYGDGAVIRGTLERCEGDRVLLRTSFSTEAVSCSLAGLSALLPGLAPSGEGKIDGPLDTLVTDSGSLRGVLSFGEGEATMHWRPVGAKGPVPLLLGGDASVERNMTRLEREPPYEGADYPSVLHLVSGERFPCRVGSLGDSGLVFDSPYLKGRELAPGQVKALDLAGKTLVLDEYPVTEQFEKVLERALMVPRFRRKNPHGHLMLARNGDMMRGELISVLGGVVRFDSKLKEHTISTERLELLVNVEAGEAGGLVGPGEKPGVRVTLNDGTVLVFEPTSSTTDALGGISPLYGEVSVPIRHLRDLDLLPESDGLGGGTFADWVTHPAPEPTWDD